MSLYRQSGGPAPRTLLLIAVAVLLLGALAGFLIGRGTAPEPSAAELVSEAREELEPVSDWLGVIPTEYDGGVGRDGEVEEPTEYGAAVDAAENASDALAEAEDMAAIDPAGYEEAGEAMDRLGAAIAAKAPPARVELLTGAVKVRIEKLAAS